MSYLHDQVFCAKCTRKLDPQKTVWLEFNNHFGTYHEPGDVPLKDSLGVYPFGRDCANNVMEKQC